MKLYSKQGDEIAEIKQFRITNNFMGDNVVSATIYSPDKLSILAYSYVDYDSHRFYVYPSNKPVENKTARTGENIGDAFSYVLTLYSDLKQLEFIDFYDYVIGGDDSNVYYTGNYNVTWYGTVETLIDRVLANIRRYYGSDEWTIQLSPDVDIDSLEEKNITAADYTIMEVVKMINDQFKLKYYVSGKTIIVGGEGTTVSKTLEYGKGKGLKNLKRSYVTSDKLITRMKVFGSEKRNLPEGYRVDESTGFQPKNLLLPSSWGKNYIDIDWNNDPIYNEIKAEYGIIEGSREYDDIFPSIEGAKDSQGNPLDQIIENYPINDTDSTFTVRIWNPSFNPFTNALTGQSPQISIKAKKANGDNSNLGGYNFTIVNAYQEGEFYTLRLNRDTSEPTPVPNSVVNLQQGDRFVYLGIQMPTQYITFAEERLLERCKVDIQDNNGIVINYNGIMSSIYLNENQDVLSDLLPGNYLKISDADYGIENLPIQIQNVSVDYKDLLPIYKVSLSNIKYRDLLERQEVENQNQNNVNSILKNTVNNINNNLNIQNGETAVWEIIQ